MSLAKCPTCGHEVSSLAERCQNCGTPAANRPTPCSYHGADPSRPRQLAAVRCFECGHEVSVLAYTCHNCGAPLKEHLTPASPHEDEPHDHHRGGRRARVLQPALLGA